MGIRELFSSSGDDATRIRCKKTKEGLLCKLKTRDGQIATAEAIVDRDGQIALSDFEGTPSAVDE